MGEYITTATNSLQWFGEDELRKTRHGTYTVLTSDNAFSKNITQTGSNEGHYRHVNLWRVFSCGTCDDEKNAVSAYSFTINNIPSKYFRSFC